MYIFETYLNLRQHAALRLPTLPKTLVGVIRQETFEKSRAYCIDKSNLHFVKQFVTIIMDSATLLFGVLPRLWKITDLPFSLYSTFVIEEQHGFNKQTFWLFIRDMLKGMTLAGRILILLLFGGYTLVKNSNDLFMSFRFDTQPVLIEFILFQVHHTLLFIIVSINMCDLSLYLGCVHLLDVS
ncbi:putative ste24 endopeptidase [Helianthus annuus]|nr:putative ste24 endopeptidase [Helianthus annuus]